VKENPGVGPFTLAMKPDPHHHLGLGEAKAITLLKTDVVRRLLAEEGVTTPLVTSASGR